MEIEAEFKKKPFAKLFKEKYKGKLFEDLMKDITKENKVNGVIEGSVKNITDYALFISIKNAELDGMIHYKDLDWNEKEAHSARYDAEQTAILFCEIVNRWNGYSNIF